MRSQIKLGRIAGIEIGLHYSWFIIAFLIALSLASHFRSITPAWNPEVVWIAAGITAVLFFATLLLHELAHSVVAQSRGLRVRAITLFALGGVSQIESDAPDAKSEFWIAIVGPITSAVLAGIFLLLARVTGWAPGTEPTTPIPSVLLWLGYINFALAAFNMIPGFPLDGGRVLRAILWWISHSADRATRWASLVGQGVALLFIMWGVFRFFVGESFGGLWIAFIGWFLLDAARSTSLQAGILSHLRDRSVADVMERNCTTVQGYLNLRDFVDEYLLHSAGRCFLVANGDQVTGMLTSAEIRQVPRDQWAQTSVQAVMVPIGKLRSVPPEMPAAKALELMGRENLSQLAVVSNGQFQGIFSQAQVLRYLQIYSENPPEPQHKTAA
ncbi:MAG: site-2 protease family protein [Terriglobales bacterium]